MLKGIVINMDYAPGFGAIQPEDGSELMMFAHSDVNEPIEPNAPVVFDTAKGTQGGGAQAVNIRIVKAE